MSPPTPQIQFSTGTTGSTSIPGSSHATSEDTRARIASNQATSETESSVTTSDAMIPRKRPAEDEGAGKEAKRSSGKEGAYEFAPGRYRKTMPKQDRHGTYRYALGSDYQTVN